MRLSPHIHFFPGSDWAAAPAALTSNTVVITGSSTLIIDPGLAANWPRLKSVMRAEGLNPMDIGAALFTHGHADHLDSGPLLAGECGAALALRREEADFLRAEGKVFYSGLGLSPPKADFLLLPEGPWEFGGHKFLIFHTPGHSPGGLCLYWPEEKLLVTGDLYFPGTIGAFDYPGGSAPAMYASIARVRALDVETVLCGHGEPILGRDRVQENNRMLDKEIAEKKAKAESG